LSRGGGLELVARAASQNTPIFCRKTAEQIS
jgi:hypothetical protein